MMRVCPSCNKSAAEAVRPQGFWERSVLTRLGHLFYRCQACGTRFHLSAKQRRRRQPGLKRVAFEAPAGDSGERRRELEAQLRENMKKIASDPLVREELGEEEPSSPAPAQGELSRPLRAERGASGKRIVTFERGSQSAAGE